MHRRTFGLLMGASLFAPNIVRAATAPTVLKAGHISPKGSPEGIAADRWAELAKEKSGGGLVIEIYPSEQLGPATAMIESTMLGNQDIYIGGNVEFERFSPALKALDLNYAVPGEAQFQRILHSPLWNEMFVGPLEKAGLKVIASDWERGPFRVMVSTRPVRNFDDMKGLKLRIAPIDTWRRSWTALGCQVVVLPWTDTYLGLQQGTIEAVTSPINLVLPMKFPEIAKHVARTDEYWGVLTVVMNGARHQQLPPAYQRVLQEAALQAGREYMDSQKKQVDRDLETMKKQGVEYTVLDLKPGIDKMKPVIQQLEKEDYIPKGIYEKLQSM